MKLKPMLGDKWTDVLAFITFGALICAGWLLAGAGLFRPGGRYLTFAELDQIGGFLGGVFAPIVLAWAARSFFLQRTQLVKSMEAMAAQAALMAKQAELQNEANSHQTAQLIALERHREEDRRLDEERTAPRFSLRSISNMWSGDHKAFKFVTEITNVGAFAVGYRLSVYSVNKVGDKPYLLQTQESATAFRPEESRQIDIYIPDATTREITQNGFICELEAIRSDQRVTFQTFSSNSMLNYFEPVVFMAVAADRKLRLPAFGGS